MGNSAPQATGTMKALARESTGVFAFREEHPSPATPTPGSGMVLVRVKAAAINPVDYKFGKGILGPLVGQDFSGVVIASGDPAFAAGDAVLGRTAKGAMAERVVTSAKWLAKKPASLGWEQAAALVTSYQTAWDAFHVWSGAAFKPGCSVLVVGASGGVGSAAVQLALAQGATTVVGVCSTANVEFCRNQGATAVVDYKTTKYGDVYGGDGEEKFDVVFNTVSRDFADALRVVKPNTGWVAGINPKGTGEAMAYLTGLHRLTYPTRQTPFFLTNWTAASLAELATLASTPREDGSGRMKLAPVVATVLPFTAANAAKGYDMLKTHRTVGKIVFVMDGEEGGVGSFRTAKIVQSEK